MHKNAFWCFLNRYKIGIDSNLKRNWKEDYLYAYFIHYMLTNELHANKVKNSDYSNLNLIKFCSSRTLNFVQSY